MKKSSMDGSYGVMLAMSLVRNRNQYRWNNWDLSKRFCSLRRTREHGRTVRESGKAGWGESLQQRLTRTTACHWPGARQSAREPGPQSPLLPLQQKLRSKERLNSPSICICNVNVNVEETSSHYINIEETRSHYSKMCAKCVQYVCKMCARCLQGVLKMCARCMHMPCLMSLNPTHLENLAHVGS